TSVAPKAFLTSRIATDAMDAPLFGPLRVAPARGLFRVCFRRRRAPLQQPGLPIGRDYGRNFNSRLVAILTRRRNRALTAHSWLCFAHAPADPQSDRR